MFGMPAFLTRRIPLRIRPLPLPLQVMPVALHMVLTAGPKLRM